MRYCLLALAAVSLTAQDASRQLTTYTYDLNGRRVPVSAAGAAASSSGSLQVETTTTVNGRQVPLESVEEKTLSQGPDGRVIERLVRRFDANGRPAGTEKVRVEERVDPAGARIVQTTVYDSDLNGRFAVRESSTSHSTVQAGATRTETQIRRPNLSGALDVVERRSAVQTGSENNLLSETVVSRRDANGSFAETERQTTQRVVSADRVTVTTADYNVHATGQMLLAGQRVSRTQKTAGGETEIVDVYGGNTPGRAASGHTPGPKLREQQVIERRPGPDGSLVETFLVRRADLETGRLGPEQKISETVCRGKCLPDPPKPEPPKP